MSTRPLQRKESKIKLILANHDTLVAAALRSYLHDLPEIELLREIPLGSKTLASVLSSKPDVLFIYLSMSGYEEVEIAARVAKKLPHLAVIVLSMNTSVEYILQTLH